MGRWFISLCAFAGVACAGDAPPAPPAATDAKLIPVEKFTKFDEFGTIKISPDGDRLAITTGRYGRGTLVFVSLKTKSVTGSMRADDPYEIDDFTWASNDRVVFSIAERYGSHATPYLTGEIFAIDAEGGQKSTMLYGYRAGEWQTGTHMRVKESTYGSAELLSVLKGDPRNVLITESLWKLDGRYLRYDPDARPRVLRLDIYNGKKKTVDVSPLRGGSVLLDRNHEVRFAVGSNSLFKFAVSWRPKPDAPWTDFELPGFRAESVHPWEFSADNKSVYLTGVREDDSYSGLFRLNLETHELERVPALEGIGITSLVRDVSGHEIVGVRGYAEKPAYRWLTESDPTARLYTSLQRAFPNQDVEITSTSADGKLAIVFVDSDTNPGDFYLFDTGTKHATYLRSSRSWIDPKQMRPKEPISFTARDGLQIHGYVTRPNGAGPAPMVVLPHGGPHHIRDVWDYDWEAQLLASRGYAVLQVNFRGSGGYGMDFEWAGHRQWGASMQDDLTDATRWAIEQKITSEDRICIFGASYGGYAALMGAAREPKLYRCAIGYAGVYDLELMYETGDTPDSRTGLAYLEQVLGTDRDDLHARSPTHNAARIEIPVLLIHGKEDWRADFAQAKRMKAALEQAGKKVEWMALSHEGHGAYNEETRRQVYERVLQFLDQHLQPARTASAAAN